MPGNCQKKVEYFQRYRENREATFNQVLGKVQEVFPNASFKKGTEREQINQFGSLIPYEQGRDRYVSLDHYVFISNFQRNLRGCYNQHTGRIFLDIIKWCFSTIIHETLHGCSIFAQEINVGDNNYFLNEGLTDLMTGYVLWRTDNDCYIKWRDNNYNECNRSETYYRFSKLWFTLFRFVDLNEISKLYFGENGRSWNEIWNDFLALIKIVEDNSDPFSNIGTQHDDFETFCNRHYGRAFQLVYDTESYMFDFNKCAKSANTEEEYEALIGQEWVLVKEVNGRKILRAPIMGENEIEEDG